MGGDDSAVVVDLDRLPDEVAVLVFMLTMRLEETEALGQLSYVGCRVYDDPFAPPAAAPGATTEYCCFEVVCSQLYGSNAVYLARLERVPRPQEDQHEDQHEEQHEEQQQQTQVDEDKHKQHQTRRTSKLVDLSTSVDEEAKDMVPLPHAVRTKHRKRRAFDLSIDEPSPQEDQQPPSPTPQTRRRDDWKFVAAAEAIEGSVPAFAAYAVSEVAAPYVQRREEILRVGGASEESIQCALDTEFDFYDSSASSSEGDVPLFQLSDKLAREAEDDHYAGFVEYAIMQSIAQDAQRAPQGAPGDRRLTMAAPPRPSPQALMKQRRRHRHRRRDGRQKEEDDKEAPPPRSPGGGGKHECALM